MNKQVNLQNALTFDDVLILPKESDIVPSEVLLNTHITKNISLTVPVISAAMDTITESKMAIKMAQLGGIGVIHKNMPIENQAKMVNKVKNFEGGVIYHPINLNHNHTLADYFDARRSYGFSSFPIIKEGTLNLIGFVSEKDVKFISDPKTPLIHIMTPKEKLITVSEQTPAEESRDIMHRQKIEQVLVINSNEEIIGMIPSEGFVKANLYNNATRDKKQRLMVGAAVGTGDNEKLRVEHLVKAQVDIIVVDTAHGHSQNVKNMVQFIKKEFPFIDVIAGNIATYDAAKFLIDAGADCLKVGIGSGSICTTRIISGVGVPQLTALLEVERACRGTGISFIADGGLKQSGDIAKALGTGACAVMMGSLLAGTDETPGNLITQGGQQYKEYRGMGSISAMMQGSADRYFQSHNTKQRDKLVPEGVESRVDYKGPLDNVLYQMLGGLKSSMGYTGSKTLKDFYNRVEYVQITGSGLLESHVHSVKMIGESPNYKRS